MKHVKLNYFDAKGNLYENYISALVSDITRTFNGDVLIKFKVNKKADTFVYSVEKVRSAGKCFCTLTQYMDDNIKVCTQGYVSSTVMTNRLEILIKVTNITIYKAGKQI